MWLMESRQGDRMMETVEIDIRPLTPGDYRDAGRIYFCAVHEGTRGVYSHEQRRAWGGETIDLPHWKDRIAGLDGFVAVTAGEPVGFMTVDASGYIDLAFVLPSCAGKGVGRRLLAASEQWALGHGATQLSTHASKAARPFFEANGWRVEEEETIERRSIVLTRYRMRKAMANIA